MTEYNHYIIFKRMNVIVKGYCSILDIQGEFVTVELEHGREHIIPGMSLIDLIRNARGSEKLSDRWDLKIGGWNL